MNTINNNAALAASATSNNAATKTAATGQTAAADQRNMFMTLLVAQLKNQDPLAPQDGAQFVAQLAQFNSLDQLVGIRQSLDALVAAGKNNGSSETNSFASQAASLLKQIKQA